MSNEPAPRDDRARSTTGDEGRFERLFGDHHQAVVAYQVAGPDQSDATIAALSAAESFVEAHGAGDVATIEGLLVEWLHGGGPIGTQFEGAGTGVSVEYRVASMVARQTALGLFFTDGSCRVYSETPLVVTCNYLATSRVHDIDGTAPNPATFTIHFEDALISEVTLVCHLSTPSFDEFVRQHGPLTGADAPSDPYDRLRVYVDLYEASVRGSG